MNSLTTLLDREPADCKGMVIATLGSGGKTTLLSLLAGELALHHERILISTSTKVFPFPDIPTVDRIELLEQVFERERVVFFGRRQGTSGKLSGPEEVSLQELRSLADVVLLEADGAYRRSFKIHLSHDPILPAEVDLAIAVVGASVLGLTISKETVHRAGWAPVEWGVELGKVLDAATMVRVMLAPDGYLGKAGVTPLGFFINQEDQFPLQAEELAAALVDRWPGPVVTGSAREGIFNRHDRDEPRPSLVLLAAGSGSRFGEDKRLVLLKGRPLLEWCLRAYAGARVYERLLVLGEGDEELIGLGLRYGFRPVICRDAAEGMGHSLRAGLGAVSRGADSVLIGLGDKPAIRPETVAQILCDAQCYPGRVLQPTHQGEPGHPLLVPQDLLPPLDSLGGDRGLRDLLPGMDPFLLECSDPGVILDLDRPDQLTEIEEHLPRDIVTDET